MSNSYIILCKFDIQYREGRSKSSSLVSLVEQEPFTLPEHLHSLQVFTGIRVTWSLVFMCFVDRCLSFCPFYFGHCVVCSSIYKFWFPFWYLQTLLTLDWSQINHEWICGDWKSKKLATTVCRCRRSLWEKIFSETEDDWTQDIHKWSSIDLRDNLQIGE